MQSQTIQCSIKTVEVQGPTGANGPTGQGVPLTGSTGAVGPQGVTGPSALNALGLSYTQTFPTTGINTQDAVTISPTLPSNFPPGIYLVICNMQITPVNAYELPNINIAYSGLLTGTNYTNVTELNV
jgi:hypothetical protein